MNPQSFDKTIKASAEAKQSLQGRGLSLDAGSAAAGRSQMGRLRGFAVVAYIRTAGQGLVLSAQVTKEHAVCKTMIQKVKMPL
jgi:hypothetical protein